MNVEILTEKIIWLFLPFKSVYKTNIYICVCWRSTNAKFM